MEVYSKFMICKSETLNSFLSPCILLYHFTPFSYIKTKKVRFQLPNNLVQYYSDPGSNLILQNPVPQKKVRLVFA